MNANAPTPAPKTTSPRTRTGIKFGVLFILGLVLYGLGLAASGLAPSLGISPWWAAPIIVIGIGVVACTNVLMYRNGDEFEKAKMAESVLLAFTIAAPLIAAIGVLQYSVLPEINWIFAFVILMVSWLLGSLISTVRYR